MKTIEKHFDSSDNTLASTIMKKLSGMGFDSSQGLHNHIIE